MAYCAWNGSEKYRDTFVSGTYVCSQCGYELFSSRSKFSHTSPWPAFLETVHADSVTKRPEMGRPSTLKAFSLAFYLFDPRVFFFHKTHQAAVSLLIRHACFMSVDILISSRFACFQYL
ncbi:unnamed protein product [Ixodes pacificus]